MNQEHRQRVQNALDEIKSTMNKLGDLSSEAEQAGDLDAFDDIEFAISSLFRATETLANRV